MTDEHLAEREALLKQCVDAVEALLRAKRPGAFGGAAFVALREVALKEAEQRLRDWEAANKWTATQ